MLGIGEALWTDDRRAKALSSHRRKPVELTGGDLQILRLQRVVHVDRGEPVAVELGGVEPDAHGVLRTEQMVVADPGGASDWVLDVRGDVVAHILAAHRPIGRNEADHQQEIARRFGHAQPLLLNYQWQERRRQLQFVLYLHLAVSGLVPCAK